MTRAVHTLVPDVESERGPERSGLHEKIMQILKPGKENAITMPVIEERLGYEPTKSQQKIRQACIELMVVHKTPIVKTWSRPRGAYLAQTQSEADEYIHNLKARRDALNDDIRVMKEIREELPTDPPAPNTFRDTLFDEPDPE